MLSLTLVFKGRMLITFGLRTFGFMNTEYNIDVVAYPTNAGS